jgi:hypothetical protein
MKKIFLSAVFVASSWMLFAQDTTNRTNNTMNNTTSDQQMNSNTNQNTTTHQSYNTTSTSNYNAYGIPNYVQMNFQTQYPTVSNLTWTAPTADWYHGYYSDANGRYTHVYYSTDPYYSVKYYPERVVGYTVSLPVLQTYVPDAVITTATNLYKQNLYDITAIKGNNKQDIYLVRVQDNGELKSMWMDAGGTAITDYWRTEEQMNMNNTTNSTISTDTNAAMDSNSSMNNNMNNNVKTKTKTIMSDGSQIKTKTKNGKTTTKKSGSTTNDNNQF